MEKTIQNPNVPLAQTERNREIVRLSAEGYSFNVIARKFNLTPQRAHQIATREKKREQEKGRTS